MNAVAAGVDPAVGRLHAVRRSAASPAYANERVIPARSRTGERLRRRSGSERAGLALEVDHDPVAVGRPEDLAEVVVAVRPDREPGRADGGELLDEVAEVLRAVRDRAERVVLRERRDGRCDLLVDLGGEQRERLGARLLGREVRVGVLRGERRVQPRRYLTEPPRALRQPRRVVAERLEGELQPPPPRDEPVTDASAVSSGGPSVSTRPRAAARCEAAPRAPEDFELGVRPCLEPAVELQHVELVEDDRAVRLLDARAAARARPRPHAGQRREPGGDLGRSNASAASPPAERER